MPEPPPEPFTVRLRRRHASAWEAATRAPFLEGVRDGSLPSATFDAWLVQDRQFVAGLYGAQARLLAQAPEGARRPILGGLVALQDELDWFDGHAGRRGLNLQTPASGGGQAYVDYLQTLAFAPYPAGITALWAVEQAYLEAWRWARPGAAAYREFVEHWTTAAFAAYVRALEAAVDGAAACAGEAACAEAEGVFLRVAAFEEAFWRGFTGGPA